MTKEYSMQIYPPKLTNLLVCALAPFLFSCASLVDPRYFTDEKRLDGGSYVNGRDTIRGSNFAFVAANDSGIVLVEFDSKPFFLESRVSQNNRLVSPLRLSIYAADLIISPGQHSITVRYESVEPAGLLGATLGIDQVTARINTETKLEFVAENGHTYLINGNVTTDRKTRGKIWHPEIQDLPPKQRDR